MPSYELRKTPSAKELSDLQMYPHFLQTLLTSRGILTSHNAEKFFDPQYERDLHDPFLLLGMNKAVERILQAIEQKEKIVIYSDYDADGIPGGAMLRSFFDSIGYENVENYIPHRHDEGFGLHEGAVASLADKGAHLIITIDCGIADVVAGLVAKEKGVDLIITDHHESGDELPHAYAIIDHKQPGCTYPEQVLCGSGVAYKLVQGILAKNRFGLKEGYEKWLLDLVGIATLSDMVPLTGENRALAHFGLRVLRKSPRYGLQEMWKKLRINQRYIVEDDIGFSFSPRINAASRMGHPMDAFALLSAKSMQDAVIAAEVLEGLNAERKTLVAQTVKELKKALREKEAAGPLPKVIVLGNPNWKPALLGLVANNLLDEVRRPIFLWGRNGDGTIKGSCRSDGSASLISIMEHAKGSFVQFGGHKMAGGFAVYSESIHRLEEALNTAYEAVKESDSEGAVIHLDAELALSDIHWKTYDMIQKLAPFGVGNPKPLFLIRQAEIQAVKQFGGTKNHLEVAFVDEERVIKAIKFFATPESFNIPLVSGSDVDVVCTLEKSIFGRGSPELRLRIIDII